MGRGGGERERGGDKYVQRHTQAGRHTDEETQKEKGKGRQTERCRVRETDRQTDRDRNRDTERETRRDKEKESKSLTFHSANRDVWMGKRNVRFQSDLVTHLKLCNKLF